MSTETGLPIRFDWICGLREIVEGVDDRAQRDGLEDGYGAEDLAIECDYRRKLFGARHLSRQDRPHALRNARDWRAAALRALNERRSRDRHAARLLRRLIKPVPI